jgi:hypothetical protein
VSIETKLSYFQTSGAMLRPRFGHSMLAMSRSQILVAVSRGALNPATDGRVILLVPFKYLPAGISGPLDLLDRVLPGFGIEMRERTAGIGVDYG